MVGYERHSPAHAGDQSEDCEGKGVAELAAKVRGRAKNSQIQVLRARHPL
jgi:hypothetical protein